DPVVADQSFSGCLSNRNLLLANEETLRPESVARVFEILPGNWEIQGLPANGAHYQLMSAQGQTLISGSTTTETARFKTASLPVGMYYLRINDDNGLSRIMRVISSY
ncbi:MAG TPA: T9SS type A sorting domain-containing protein, partial [Catalimonadaceae bacterium]|nr:T9SS type A sorting domain-containing protein [Catalimonadaceae bacterium]